MTRQKYAKPQLDVYVTPNEIAKSLRVSRDKVVGWIRRGELVAANVGEGRLPRYRVSPHYLHEFLKAREVPQPSRRVERRRRQAPPGGPLDPVLGEELLKTGQAVKDFGKYYRLWEGQVLYF